MESKHKFKTANAKNSSRFHFYVVDKTNSSYNQPETNYEDVMKTRQGEEKQP